MPKEFASLQPWKPHPRQAEFLANPAKIKVLACGRRWGKTDVCAAEIASALLGKKPVRALILAPTASQSELLFSRIEEFVAHRQPKVKRTPYPLLTLGEHRVMARSGHAPRSLRGLEATHIVIDEAAYLPESLVTEVAMPMLATTDGRLTMISTPRGMNHFWRFFRMGERGEHGIWSRQAPSQENPFVRAEYLEVQKELISERAYRVEYGAEFVEVAGRVFRSEAIEDCLVTSVENKEKICIGIDWARYRDYTAVAVVSGCREDATLLHIERFNQMTWDLLVERTAEIIQQYKNPLIVCDATGVGDLSTELLEKRLTDVRLSGVKFNSGFKHELIDRLAWMFEKRAFKMLPNPDLLRELEYFEAKPTASGGTRLEATGGMHDDMVIALSLAAHGLESGVYRPIQVGRQRQFRWEASTDNQNLCFHSLVEKNQTYQKSLLLS